MPLYEYVCSACHTRFEHIRLMKEADLPAPCPRCATLAARQLSRFALKRTVAAPSTSPAPRTRTHTRGCPCCMSF